MSQFTALTSMSLIVNWDRYSTWIFDSCMDLTSLNQMQMRISLQALMASDDIHQICADNGYIPLPTSLDSPIQNGMNKRPNQTLAHITHCLLHSA